METLKMTQALDEKGFLKKKIQNQIRKMSVIAVSRNVDCNDKTKEDFSEKASAQYQSVVDQIDRYNRLSRAIIRANAECIVEVNGIEMSRAEAISLRSQLKTMDNLEQRLLEKLRGARDGANVRFNELTAELRDIREKYTNSMIANSASKDKSSLTDADIEAVNKLTDGYVPEIIDPITIEEKIESYGEKYDNLLQALETAIKLSNATTDVTF